MENSYGFVDKQTAQDAIRAFNLLQRSGALSPGFIETTIQKQPKILDEPLQFVNRSGEEIPRYGCIQITGIEELEDRTIFVAEKPVDTDESAGPFVFNGHHAVPDNEKGTAQKDRVLRAISDGSALAAGDHWQPKLTTWTIEPNASGRFVMIGSDSLVEDACWIFLDPMRCCGTCRVGSDDFNRTDENPVTGNWTEISGDWEVVGNELNSVSDGILITSLRQATPTRTGAGYANTVLVDLDNTGGITEWHIVTNFSDSNNFWWIKVVDTAGTLKPAFYVRSGGTDTLIMDSSTHPLGTGWTLVSGRLTVVVCTSDIEWSIYPSSQSEAKWQTCYGDVVTSLPATASHGLVGVKKGRFDNFVYDIHWESQLNCPGCNCACFVDNSNAACIPEELVLTLVPASGPYDYGFGMCSTPANIVISMYQQAPATGSPPTLPTFGASYKTPRKYIWYSEVLDGEGGAIPIHGVYVWFILVCDTFRGQAYLLAREYPDSSVTTDPPIGSGLMPYWTTEETDLVNGAKRFDLGSTDCTPISMVFPGLNFPRSAAGQCDIYGTIYDVYVTE